VWLQTCEVGGGQETENSCHAPARQRHLALAVSRFELKPVTTISLKAGSARWSFSLAILLCAALYTAAAAKAGLAGWYAATPKPELWHRAVQLEPDDSVYWDKVGGFERWDFDRGDLRRAIQDFGKAAEINPHSDRYWMDLAGAYEAVGEVEHARAAFEKAQWDHPISAEVAWRFANFLLRQENLPKAYAEFHRAVLADPNLAYEATDECWKATRNVAAIFDEVLPAGKHEYLSAMICFLRNDQLDAALAGWDRVLKLGEPLEMGQALPLLNELIRQGRVEDAVRVWERALEVTGWPRNPTGDSSVVFNGGFEHDLLNGGFDWREEPVAGASFDFDQAVFYRGQRSLRVTFDGTENLNFQHLLQYVPVEPKRDYHFSAYVGTQGISTERGIRFQITDALHPEALQILTPELVGTHPWSEVKAEFSTGPETHLLVVVLRRTPAWKFDNKLRGTVWVDEVSLQPVARAAKAASP
jgi:tetratricopeptide (TPR) repeat protein